jgi:hypothetical protein
MTEIADLTDDQLVEVYFRPEGGREKTKLKDGTVIQGDWTTLTKEHFFSVYRKTGLPDSEIQQLWDKDYGSPDAGNVQPAG